MHLLSKFTAVGALALCIVALPQALADPSALRRVGHDGVDVDPAVKRYAGMVTALGAADSEGRIYSFQATRLPAAAGYAVNELRGWRLTVLAGKRFASVFEVASNTESEITVAPRDGPLNGLAVRDVFVVEQIAIDRQQSSDATESKPNI
jgi:hypothetical protein